MISHNDLLQHAKEIDTSLVKHKDGTPVKVTLPKDNSNLIPPVPENKNANNEAVQKRMAGESAKVAGKVPAGAGTDLSAQAKAAAKGTTGTDLSAQAKAAAKGADPSSQGKPAAGTTVPVYQGSE